MMRTPLIAGNWKMYKTLAEARALVGDLRTGLERLFGAPRTSPDRRVDHAARACGEDSSSMGPLQSTFPEVLICPPFPLLFPMAKAVAGSSIMLGAQNVHEEPFGAFTGEISVAMLADTGCTHVIVGHSERRQLFGETNDRLARKVRAVTESGLIAVYCVGETLEERESERTQAVVGRQLEEVVGREVPARRLVIAYEPVWAIGTGKTATPEQAQEVHRFIRGRLGSIFDGPTADTIRILYGGSVKPGNAAGLLGQLDIDGALVGGACLVAEDFLAIIAAARPV